MLSPRYLDVCADEVLGIYDNLQTAIAEDVARSLVKHGKIIETAGWQVERAEASGRLLDEVVEDVANISNLSEKYVRKAFEDAAKQGLMNDAEPLIEAGLADGSSINLSESMTNVLQASVDKTLGSIRNLTGTLGSTTRGMYLEQTNQAYMKVASGAYTYQKAIADAIRNAAQDGNYVIYGMRADGKINRSQLDVAVRRSVMTGINQTCGQITEMYAQDMDVQYYEVSAHLGARPSHQVWQGQVYKIDGSDKDYKNFYEATGYGTGDGLCGWNCRHSFFPFWPGISKRAYTKEKLDEYANKKYLYNGRMLTEYECTQMQRAFERDIRKTKRELASYDAAMKATSDQSQIDELKDRFDTQSVRLKNLETGMNMFCSATNRQPDSFRTQVFAYKDQDGRIVNFGHSQSMKAVWADRKANAAK